MEVRQDKKFGDYLVLCREDRFPTPGSIVTPDYVLASQGKTFKDASEAFAYARAINSSRDPIIVRVIAVITGQEVS